jgi:GH24 family phage-related lysozyme (muramidase)
MSARLRDIARAVLLEDTKFKGFSVGVQATKTARTYTARSSERGETTASTTVADGEPITAFKLSQAGRDKVARMEGNVSHVYNDLQGSGAPHPQSWDDTTVKTGRYKGKTGTLTIGMGVAIGKDRSLQARFNDYLKGRKAPSDVIDGINSEKIGQFESAIAKQLKPGAKLTQAMFDALFSLAWNAGPGNSGVINAAKAINKGDYQAAKDAIASSTAVSGTTGEVLAPLQQRRREEAELFASMGMNPGGGSAEPEEKA